MWFPRIECSMYKANIDIFSEKNKLEWGHNRCKLKNSWFHWPHNGSANDTFRPFIKRNKVPLYINRQSNHPPSVLRNIPDAINKRLSQMSCNETVYNAAATAYQDARQKWVQTQTEIWP